MSLSEKDFAQMMKGSHARIIGGLPAATKEKGKKRVESKKVIIDGIEFDSKIEGDIYWEFEIDPEIEILELQPFFELLPKFKRFGKTYQSIDFTPDFKIKQNSEIWVVEVKSLATLKANSKSYPMRRKLFLAKNPTLRFREIIFDGASREEKIY